MTHKSRDGFTLLELLLVVAIFAIIATMSVPMIGQSLKTWRTDRLSRSLLTSHQAARFRAITENALVQVRYNISSDRIRFYICKNLNDSGDCPSGSWGSYPDLDQVTFHETVDLWSVGDVRSGDACMYYKPNGQTAGPYDRSGTSGEECSGNSTGQGVHITWQSNPETAPDGETACRWNTIYHTATGTSNPVLLDYGAYPGSGAFGNWSIGTKPSCAE